MVAFVVAGIGFNGFLQIMQLTISEGIQQRIFAKSAFEFIYRIPRIRLESLYKHYPPELMNRFFDTLTVQKGISKLLTDFSTAILTAVFGIILLSFYHPFFVIFGISLVALVWVIFRFTGPAGLETSLRESKFKYEVAHWLEEVARVSDTFKLSGCPDLPLKKADSLVTSYLEARGKHFRILITQYASMVVFKVIVAAGLLLLGGLLVIDQELNIGQFVAAEIVILMIISSVEKLVVSMETVYDILTALEKIGYVTDLPLEQSKGLDYAKLVEDSNGTSIEVSDLTFAYPGTSEPIFKKISVDIQPGEKLVLSGPSGTGKSTFLHLAGGLYSDFSGGLTYNGIPFGNINLASLHTYVGDALGMEKIFRGTLEENISLGRPFCTFGEVKAAVDAVHLNDFLASLPEGFDTLLDPQGQKLPRNVVSKIILARGIVNKPSLLVLDDIFHGIPPLETQSILDMLFDKSAPWTLLIASNNPVIIGRADRVMVFDENEKPEIGAYDDLKNHDFFQRQNGR